MPLPILAGPGSRLHIDESPSFDAQLLYTAQDMSFRNDPGTTSVEWRTDEAEGYARLSYAGAGFSGLYHTLVNQASAQVYVSYWVRRHGLPCTKQLKINGVGEGAAKNNSTWGPTANGYSTNEFTLQYGDGVSGGNDNGVSLTMDGELTGGGAFTRAEPTYTYAPSQVTQDVGGTVWLLVEVFTLHNSPGQKNGRFGAAINGSRVLQLDDVYNTSDDANARFREYVGIAEYTGNSSSFIEDYKRVDISTRYLPSWMT